MVGPRRAACGYIPNADTIHPALSLDRVLQYTAALRGAGDRDGAAAEVLRAVDLAGRAATRVGELDAGQRKRAAIAVELLAEPSQLFLEEPTIGLDPAQGTEVMRRLRRLCESGITVVLTTQNPLDAVRCDKVAVLATGGHLAFFGTPGRRLRLLRGRQPRRDLRAAGWSRRPCCGLVPPLPPVFPNGPRFHRLPDRSAATGAGRAAARHRGPALGRPRVRRPAVGLLDDGLAEADRTLTWMPISTSARSWLGCRLGGAGRPQRGDAGRAGARRPGR